MCSHYRFLGFVEVLSILKPVLLSVQIISCDDSRIVEATLLENTLKKLNIEYNDFDINIKDESNDYLVFGSFLVVESFLKVYASGK